MRSALLKRRVLNSGSNFISYIKLIPWLFRLNKNSVVIDCGANTGQISLFLARTGVTIYSFEPDPIAFKVLSEKSIGKKNITCYNKGVWDKNATVKLHRHNEIGNDEVDFTVGSSIIKEKKNVNINSFIEIEVIDLVLFIKSLNRKIDLIKLDVEGAEIEILKKIIDEDVNSLFKIMYVETHETKIPGQSDELILIKQQMADKGITNIKLNWI